MIICASASADTTTLVCDYKVAATTDGLQLIEESFVLTFLTDDETSKSYLIGNNGSEEVQVIENSYSAWTFVEITNSGNVMTTTVTESGDSVHSRNSVILGDLVPSQYYGKCEAK